MPPSLCRRFAWSPTPEEAGNTLACATFVLVAIYLWTLPIGHTIAVRHLAFFPLVLLTFWAAWKQRLELHLPLALPWLLYGGIALLSVSYAINPAYSLGEVKKEVGYAMLSMLIAASWVRDRESLSRVIDLVVLGNVLMVGAALIKGFVIAPFWHTPFPMVDSLYDGVGVFSTYLIIVIPFLVAYTLPLHRGPMRRAMILLLAGNVLALFLTGNRMGLIALISEIMTALGLVLWISGNRFGGKKLFAGVTALILILGIAAGSLMKTRSQHEDEDPRLGIWRVAIDNIQSAPLSGGGFGREAFKMRNANFAKNRSQSWHAHNMVLNKGVQMGIPGILSFLALLAAALYATWPSRKYWNDANPAMGRFAIAATAMTVGVVLKNMTDDFFVNDSAFLYWTLLGATIGALGTYKAATAASDQA